MAIPTTADWDLAKENVDRWDGVVNGEANETVTLSDLTEVKTLRGVLGDYKNLEPRGAWVTSTAYVIKDLVQESGITYLCTIDHTSGTFATDLAANKWTIYQMDPASPFVLLDDFTVDTNVFYVDSTNDKVGIGTTSLSRPAKLHLNPTANSEAIKIGFDGGIGVWNGGYPYFASNAYTDGTGNEFKNIEASASIGMGVISPMRESASLTIGGVFTRSGNASADTPFNISTFNKAITWNTSGEVGIGGDPSTGFSFSVFGTAKIDPAANDEALRLSNGSLGLFSGDYLALCGNCYADGGGSTFSNILGNASVGQAVISPMRTTSSITTGGIFTKAGNASPDTSSNLSTFNTAITWNIDGEVGIGTDPVSGSGLTVDGTLRYGTHSAIGAETLSGYITILDSGGTLRKLATIS